MDASAIAVVIAARDEADRIGETVRAVGEAFPGAAVVVADDGSRDATAQVARDAGADVVRLERSAGKGGAATLAAEHALAAEPAIVLLCDADLAGSAARLRPLVDAVQAGDADLAVAVFARRVGGGFGIAVGFAHWAIRNLTGLDLQAPISGQRALRAEVLDLVTPFAPGFGMEIGMTVDAARAGFRVVEVEVDLEHRATGRTWRGFTHRFRQLRAFVAVWAARRRGGNG
ncbi:MAG TPA: glycosyltransferase [Solirubrobacteraceae bacterium]|nr:glycosyltransferase [Solirubrobacteraceae bacterium]